MLGHIGHRLPTMLYVDAGDVGLIVICEWCHAGEPVLEAERRSARVRTPELWWADGLQDG
jgi:hypothetical protein